MVGFSIYFEGKADRFANGLGVENGKKRGVKAISKICGSLRSIVHTCVFLVTQPLNLFLCLKNSHHINLDAGQSTSLTKCVDINCRNSLF